MGYLAGFSVLVLFGIGIYSFGYAVRNSSLLYVLLLECIIGLILILPLILFIEKISILQIFQNPQNENWIWLSAASITGVVGGNYFSLLNIKTAGEKINSLLSPAITAFTILLSYIFLNESLTLLQMLGVLITIGSVVYFLLMQKNKIDLKDKWRGFFSGIMTIICISFTVICSIKGAMHTITFLHAIWLKLLIALPLILLAFSFFNKKIENGSTKSKLYVAIFCGVICQTILAGYLWFYASFSIGVSVFQIILATFPLFMYAVDVYVLRKSKPSFLFLLMAIIAGVGIGLVVL
ncbi:MAG: EamA family transporter [Ginsengibacter sp.]